MNGWSVWFPTMKHGGGSVIVWVCFAGETVLDLLRIQGTLNQHGYHSILQRYAIPSGLRLMGLSFVFNRATAQQTFRLCKGYMTKMQSVGVLCQMTWPPQSPDLNPGKRNSSQQQLSICGNSFKTVCEIITGEAGWENTKGCAKLSSSKGWLLWRIWFVCNH